MNIQQVCQHLLKKTAKKKPGLFPQKKTRLVLRRTHFDQCVQLENYHICVSVTELFDVDLSNGLLNIFDL